MTTNLDDWYAVPQNNYNLPAVTPAVPTPVLNTGQRIYFETAWNTTNQQYEQLSIPDLSTNTAAEIQTYLDYFQATVTQRLQAIEGLLHSKFPTALYGATQSLVAGDNQYLIPNASNIQLNPIGALVKITTRGAGVNPWNSEADCGAFGWLANIYTLGGTEAGTTAFGGKQYLFFQTQILKLEQI